MSELLVTKDLVKYFGKFAAIKGINLTIQEGVLTSIIGPNGAGKTTLINLITGYLFPSSGKIFFRGDDITNLPAHKRVKRGISRSFQIMNIFRKLTAYQNIQLSILSRLGKTLRFFTPPSSYQDVADETRSILEEVGLWEKRNILAGELSHGDQRLLELAIACSTNPELCFLDEPMAGVNPVERVRVLEYIKRLHKHKKTTFVIVEHDMDVVFSLSDRIIVMHDGKILADGKPTEIKMNKEVRRVYIGEEL